MAYAKTSIGRGCCKVSKEQKEISKLASFCFVLTEILVLVAVLILNGNDVVNVSPPIPAIIIIILSIHVLMQLWELKVLVKPDFGEKFSLTVQGSHERKKSRHRRTMFGVTVSDEVRVDYDRNCEGILVYFRKVTSSSDTGPGCQPFLLPFRGWFTFFHVLIALTLMICTISIYIDYDDYNRLQDYKKLLAESHSEATQTVPPENPEVDGGDNFDAAMYGELLDAFAHNVDNPFSNFGEQISDGPSLDVNKETYQPVSELGTHPLVLPTLLCVSLILQTTAVVSSYYQAEDCGFCLPLFCIGYTRWFKHTNTYTEMIQQNIQEKHGQHLQQEGEQLELAIRRNAHAQRTLVNDVTYHNVGPQTAKRYEDQIVLLHLLMAQEHDLACKLVFPEHSIQNKGVSFILTAEELETLNMHAEHAMETAGALKDDDTVTVIDTTELIANNTVTV
eukprot:GFUD01030829.1.p1 GENE.GFUD01030829.1~~GFUD01030829.1.p1  ORF type:complete len:448 (+),score=95.58 GFUD01030829.1:107-1450(+)